MNATISKVRAANPMYFGKDNKRFFGDISYKVLHGKSGAAFLVTKTSKWSDMFDGIKKPVHTVKPLDEKLDIGMAIDEAEGTIAHVKSWLKNN